MSRSARGWGCNASVYSPLHSYAPWLPLPGRRPRLGDAPRPGLVSVEHADHRRLPRCSRRGPPRFRLSQVLNTDQGSQFTSTAFVARVQEHGIRLSMDGQEAWRDNLFVERLWKSVKYEEVYLHAYDSVPEAHQGLARYFSFYNGGRPHTALDGRTPDMVYFDGQPQQRAA